MKRPITPIQSWMPLEMTDAMLIAAVDKTPMFITDGTVTRKVISGCANRVLGEWYITVTYLDHDNSVQYLFLTKEDDYVLSVYTDEDDPDGYLMIEPEWYSKLGG